MTVFASFLVRREGDVNALATDASAKNLAILILLRLSEALSTIQPHTRQPTRERNEKTAAGDGFVLKKGCRVKVQRKKVWHGEFTRSRGWNAEVERKAKNESEI
jgi:hypothetical protein